MTMIRATMSTILEGKTYSLFGTDNDSDGYFIRIHALADDLLSRGAQLSPLLQAVRRASSKKRHLKKLLGQKSDSSIESLLLHALRGQLSPYTTNTASHLRDLSWTRRWDRTLATSEEQYHLAMLEIELTNRVHRADFQQCNTRLAFLPHCLHDVNVTCQSTQRGHDYVCKGCSVHCVLNSVTKLLRRHGVTPYIWMTAHLQSLFTRLRNEGKIVGVLGIACIPELVRGMRLCTRARVPAIGIPLDANRCARWWGQFYPNRVNLRELESLLGRETLIHSRRHTASRALSSVDPQPGE